MDRFWNFNIRRDSLQNIKELLDCYSISEDEDISKEAKELRSRLDSSFFDPDENLKETPRLVLQGCEEFTSLESDIYDFLKNYDRFKIAEFMEFKNRYFQLKDLYDMYFAPTMDNAKLWQKEKSQYGTFAKETERVFGSVISTTLKTSRRIRCKSFSSLYQLRKNFEKLVLLREGFFEKECKNGFWSY